MALLKDPAILELLGIVNYCAHGWIDYRTVICHLAMRTSRGHHFFGFGKGGLLEKGKVHFLEILENLEILEILENPQSVENKGESNHF